ncbi:MAG: hypothetical protein FJX78_04905 [Armatimonadetes bacterium]|nr:hypothetical protein [Armatimonadota bacterium]
MSISPDRIRDGGGWEVEAGYARAARRGRRIEVSGTTANGPSGTALHLGDTGAQARAALEHAIRCVERLGGRRGDVVRTRLFLAPTADWRAAAAAHRDVIGDVAPANTTLYVGELIGDGFLVEVEVEAEVLD